MKTIEFTEDEFIKLEEISKKMFFDKQDPRSLDYIRILKRPKINWGRICIFIFASIVILAIAIYSMHYIGLSKTKSLAVSVLFFMVYIIFMLKRILLCVLKIYQRYAPATLRNKCRFEPSCSEYMFLSIERHGVVKGVKKGVCRLKRCNINGGGFDLL